MIGMAGDDKNNGSLIINIRQAPSEIGSPHNPDMGLLGASEQILEAVRANDKDTLTKALKSFFNMYSMMCKRDKLEEELKK